MSNGRLRQIESVTPTTWLEVATEPDAIDQAMTDHDRTPQRARPPPPPRLPPYAQLALPL